MEHKNKNLNNYNFNNPNIVLQSWYVVAKSKQIKKGTAKTFKMLKRKITIYRDYKGDIHALDAQCPHIGADLGLSKVRGCSLICPFHHWRIDKGGKCYSANNKPIDRKARIYPALEKWDYIWIFNGPSPLFDIPEPQNKRDYYVLKSPSQHIKCHPNLVSSNGMDITHFGALHNLKFTADCQIEIEKPYKLSAFMQAYPKSKLFQKLIGVNESFPIKVKSSTIGGHIAWLEIIKPFKFNVLLTTQLANDNGCITNVFFFLPKNLNFVRALLAIHHLLHDDRPVLDTIDFILFFIDGHADRITINGYFLDHFI